MANPFAFIIKCTSGAANKTTTTTEPPLAREEEGAAPRDREHIGSEEAAAPVREYIAKKDVDDAKKQDAGGDDDTGGVRVSMLRTPAPATPLRVVVPPAPLLHTPLQQPPSLSSLNSTAYTNRISLFLFLLHLACAVAAMSFLVYKAVAGFVVEKGEARRKEIRLLKFWLPQIEGSAVLSIVLAFSWQKAVRVWPAFMVRFILWSSFFLSLSAGTMLLCFSMAATDVIGVLLVAFAVGNGLYSCWVTQRVAVTARLLASSLRPVCKFRDLNQPTYWMVAVVFVWISLWSLAVIGSLRFHVAPLVVIALVLSLLWTTEVARNVANLTVSRVVALYYLRGMESDTYVCFQRAVTRNLGSASLGSLFIPTIEALRIVARVLNLIEGEDEFMFSCAHCCLRVMESIFRYGNGWAFVHVAAYGTGLVRASQSTWALFERRKMEEVVDADMTSALWFLSGVASGSACLIVAGAWTFSEHRSYTATVSMLAFLIGYLLTRIGMALPQACVSCYYVCYAECPGNRLFDSTVPDSIQFIRDGRDVAAPTPRFPHRTPI